MEATVIIGPPGTGKSTAVMAEFAKALAAGIEPDRIAVVTYTRAARREIVDRCRAQHGLAEDDLPWVRTIHATAARLLQIGHDHFFGPRHLRDFADRHGYDFSPVSYGHVTAGADAHEWRPVTEDDRLLALYERMRARCQEPAAALREAPDPPHPTSAFPEFLARYAAFKSESWLVDYADLLAYAVAHEVRPQVRLAIVDEFQDLSEAQIRCVRHWYGRGDCDLFVAGDPDQAVYEWMGADAAWLAQLADRAERAGRLVVLGQSYRVPAAARAVAAAVIQRNAHRRRWQWRPRPDAPGRVEWVPRADAVAEALAASWAGRRACVLYRNRAHLAADAAHLHAAAAAYVVEGAGGMSPLSDEALLDAVAAFGAWGRGEGVAPSALADALRAYVRVDGRFLMRKVRGTPGGPGTRPGVLRLLDQWARPVTARDVPALGLESLYNALTLRGPLAVLTRGVRPATRAYLADVWRRHGGAVPAHPLVLTTIHGFKGREADVVALAGDMTRATWEGYHGSAEASEHRVAYVGATRTRDVLLLCDVERSDGHGYPWPTARQLGWAAPARVEVAGA